MSQPRGRPPHVPTKETQDMVESLSGFGIPQDEIAKLIGIDPKTLRLHYAEQIELGGIKATAKVAQNLFNMACKPNARGPAGRDLLAARAGALVGVLAAAADAPSRWARRRRPRLRPSRQGAAPSGATW